MRSAFSGARTGRTRTSPRTCRTTASWSSCSGKSARILRCGSASSWTTPAACTGRERRGITMIIDCHGHYTTAPSALQKFRDAQIAGLKDNIDVPLNAQTKISDDEIRDSLENAQLKL